MFSYIRLLAVWLVLCCAMMGVAMFITNDTDVMAWDPGGRALMVLLDVGLFFVAFALCAYLEYEADEAKNNVIAQAARPGYDLGWRDACEAVKEIKSITSNEKEKIDKLQSKRFLK